MRKIFLSLIVVSALVFMISFASADLQWTSQPNSLYNLGDTVNTSLSFSGTNFLANLVCNNVVQNIQFPSFSNLPPNYPVLPVPLQFVLSQNVVGNTTGTCVIRATLDGTVYPSFQFQLSNAANVTLSSQREFTPGSQVSISGTAIKQNGQNLNGNVNLNISSGSTSLFQGSQPVVNGNFNFNFTLSQTAAAGQYLVNILAYETDSGIQTNFGSSSFNLQVDQVPTTLNIVPISDASSIVPGHTYAFNSILYDQTGQTMAAPVSIIIRDSNGQMINQMTATTGQEIDVPVSYNDLPGTWSISATSSGLSSDGSFGVLRNANVSVELVNKTLLVTNMGNVPYDSPITVKLGDNKSLSFNVTLDIGQSQKYVLSAPNGNYSLQVLSPEGNQLYTGQVSLTGNAVNVQQATQGVVSFIQYPWVWIVVIVVLVFVIFFLFRKFHKKRFMKKVEVNKSFRLRDGIVVSNGESVAVDRNRMVGSRSVAEFSPSIQGEKQSATIVCLDIKNFGEVRGGKGGVSETMNRLKYLADEASASVYENGTYFFFIFAPIKTKAFNNEMAAIETGQKMKKILEDHNRLMKQKMEFGISINYGNIIAKQGMNGFKFMSLGNLISVAKRLAAVSQNDVVLSKELRNRVATDVKTGMERAGDLEYYPLQEIRNREKNQKFIKEFMSKMEREDKDRQI